MKHLLGRLPHLTTRAISLALLLTALVALIDHTARAQTGKSIKIVVPNPPGGVNDTVARLLAEQIGRAQGVTTVVENRPGGGAIIATEAVMHAPPDGGTLLQHANSFTISPHLKKVNYDPLTGFTPICYLARSPTLIVVGSTSPYRTFADLLDAARNKPGELTLASVGPGSSFHLGIEALKRAAKVDMIYVPYPGNAPALNALLGGHVTAAFVNFVEVDEQLKAGKLRALATGSLTRIDALPDVPTVAESGYKDYEVDTSLGIVAPAKTSAETAARLASWFTAALEAPGIGARLAALGLYPVAICGDRYGAQLRKQYEDYGRIIRDANIKAE